MRGYGVLINATISSFIEWVSEGRGQLLQLLPLTRGAFCVEFVRRNQSEAFQEARGACTRPPSFAAYYSRNEIDNYETS